MSNRPRSLLLVFALSALVVVLAAEWPLAGSGGAERASAATLRAPRDEHPPGGAAGKPTLGERAATIAVKAIGVRYRWGGMSPSSGFDCSGLVSWAYRHVGVTLPHSSYALYHVGRRVSRSRMKAGDVLFFSGLGHVGLYLGKGRMVHAPRSGRKVEVVRLGGASYGGRLVGARRVAS